MELEKNSDAKGGRRCFDQNSHLSSYSEEAEHMLVRDVTGETKHSDFDQTHSASVSELKFPEESLPYLSSSLDADIETCDKNRTRICCAQVEESKKEADVLERAHGDVHCNCKVCDDCRQNRLEEDSQLEYFSAHEQDFSDRNSSSEFSEQRETIGTETFRLKVPRGGVTQEQILLDVPEDCSLASEYRVGDQTCPEAGMPELPHLLQDSLSLPDCNDMTCDHQEEQTEYHSVVCGGVLESYSCGSKERVCPNHFACDGLENGEVKDVPLIDSTLPPHITTSEEVSDKNDAHIHSISVNQVNPLLSPREGAPAVAVQFCSHVGDTDFCCCEESGVCARGASCVDCSTMDAETQFPVSEILTSKNPFFGVEIADKSSHGNTSLNSELDRHETLKNVAGDSRVNQAVDASSDFRACFTTNRSTSAQVCLSSRAINTDITIMNKSRPMGWHRETCADVVYNTDWSYGTGNGEEIQSQLTEMLEERLDGNTATAGKSSQIQVQQKSKNKLSSSDLMIRTARSIQWVKQSMKYRALSYCHKVQQRAIEAELQVLNIHYQLCYQHCVKIYRLALEENACFSRCTGNTELGSSLKLVLGELKKSYDSMRMKINMGMPLNTLPPLSVEMKLSSISFSYVPSKLFKQDLCCDSGLGTRKSGSEAPTLQERKISVNMDNPQTVHLTDSTQPSDSTSSKTSKEQHKDQDIECGSVRNEEESESWFDAKEDLTVAPFSVIVEENKKQQEKQDTVDLREEKIMESGNQCSFTDVGGLSSAVVEGDLRSRFQKYQISDTLNSVDSSNDRYGFLSLEDTSKAKLAVEEMNQKKIKGKSDTGENSLQKTSAPFSANSCDAFISLNTVNVSSFAKLMKRLQEIHPEASKDQIVDALLEVRKNNGGVLNGLSISSIVERTSIIVGKSAPSCIWEKESK